MLAVLRRPRWIAYLLIAVLFGVLTANLGLWQWHRHGYKLDRRTLIEANYDGTPVPLNDILTQPDTPLRHQDQWRRIEAVGSYAAADQHVIRNRPQFGVYGYEVLVPLVLADGSAVAVDRGWVPNAADAATLPDVPAPPSGQVTVIGWLRPSEPDLGRQLPAGQLASIDVPELASATGRTFLQAYVILASESPAPPTRPAALEPPDTGLGSHFAYALQWWLTVPAGVILVVVMARQTARDENGEQLVKADAMRSGTSSGKRTKPKKVRIWDEEDA